MLVLQVQVLSVAFSLKPHRFHIQPLAAPCAYVHWQLVISLGTMVAVFLPVLFIPVPQAPGIELGLYGYSPGISCRNN